MRGLFAAAVFGVAAASSAFAADASQADGRAIYERRCSVCHGDKGDGAFWAVDSLDPPPRIFTQTDAQALGRAAMIAAVAHGREDTAMTAWSGRLSEGEIAAVVDYIRAAFMKDGADAPAAKTAEETSEGAFPGGLTGDPVKGARFFHANCAECHGHAGDGRGKRAAFMVYKPRDFTSPATRSAFDRTRLFFATARGVPGAAMPAWRTVLSEEEIADVAEYVFRAFVKPEPVEEGAGERVYLARCAYCHGYRGDARTAAARVLDPKPRDFTKPPHPSKAEVSAAVRAGRPGAAMPAFAGVLSGGEIEAVADYVAGPLARREGAEGRYHTAANGWPDHDARNAPAIPFALGEIAVDAPLALLDPEAREGLTLFRESCVSCHFGRREHAWGATPIAATESGAEEYEKGPHDVAPEIDGLDGPELEGQGLYQAACAQCHAADGTGANWIGRFLDPSPPDFTEAGFRATFTLENFAERTLRPPEDTSMPSFERVLSAEQAAAIAAYVRRAFIEP